MYSCEITQGEVRGGGGDPGRWDEGPNKNSYLAQPDSRSDNSYLDYDRFMAKYKKI